MTNKELVAECIRLGGTPPKSGRYRDLATGETHIAELRAAHVARHAEQECEEYQPRLALPDPEELTRPEMDDEWFTEPAPEVEAFVAKVNETVAILNRVNAEATMPRRPLASLFTYAPTLGRKPRSPRMSGWGGPRRMFNPIPSNPKLGPKER